LDRLLLDPLESLPEYNRLLPVSRTVKNTQHIKYTRKSMMIWVYRV